MKKFTALLLAVVMLFALTGCMKKAYEYNPKEFSKSGMTITLTEAFRVYNDDLGDILIAYESKEVLVSVLKEEFASVEGFGDFTVDEYAELWVTANKEYSPETPKTADGLVQTKYTADVDGTNFVYFTVMFKGPDAFWTFQFACVEKNYENYAPHFVQWAKSVKLS